MSIATQSIAKFVKETTIDDIPPEVIDHAKTMIIDTIGVTLIGADTDTTQIASNQFGVATDDTIESPAHVLGTSLTASPGHAAFLNGIAAHAIDFDDVHKMMGGHPSAPILPAVLSVAETVAADGTDVLRSFIVGVESELLLASILNPSHYDRGWHPTSIFGHMGAAVAVASLLDFSEDDIRHTIGIATSQASGVKGNFGTMTKPYHVGKAARSGIEAAHLANSGFTANKEALDLEFGGFFDLFKGEDGYSFDGQIEKLGEKWQLMDPPVNFKSYPCCGSTHVPIDIALQIRDEFKFEPIDIDSIKITEHPRRLEHTNNSRPASPLEAKFSVQYVVATALLNGEVWLDDFTDEMISDEGTLEILELIEVHPDPTLDDERDRYARIDIQVNGEKYSREMEHRRLRGKDEVLDKFYRCVESSSLETDAKQVTKRLDDIENISDVQSVVSDLTP